MGILISLRKESNLVLTSFLHLGRTDKNIRSKNSLSQIVLNIVFSIIFIYLSYLIISSFSNFMLLQIIFLFLSVFALLDRHVLHVYNLDVITKVDTAQECYFVMCCPGRYLLIR